MTTSNERIINFMGLSKAMTVLSALFILVSIVSLATRGLNLGLDFTGGTLIELEYAQAPQLADVRERLASAGHQRFVVQTFGSETAVLVRVGEQLDGDRVDALVAELRGADGAVDLSVKRAEVVGAQVGEELRESGGLGLLLALGMVMLYVAFRFQFKFGVASVMPLVHDIIVVLGAFSIMGWDFDLTVLAAILAVVGYSLNDTIIVADRIRENFRKLRVDDAVEVVNISLNQTLGRTMITSGTTLFVVIALAVFGGEMIRNFALALMIGIVVGTYSSIYVAANLLIMFKVQRQDLIVPVKDESVVEEEAPPEWLNRT